MAPMRSHLMHLFKTEKTKRPVSFWYGARALKEAPYVDEFHAIEKEFPNFKFNLALDRPDPEADAAGVKYTRASCITCSMRITSRTTRRPRTASTSCAAPR